MSKKAARRSGRTSAASRKSSSKATRKAKPAPKGRATRAAAASRKGAKPARKTGKKAVRRSASSARKTSSVVSPAPVVRAEPVRDVVALALASLRFTRKVADDQLDGLPDTHALAQLPGATNHKAWTLGHQALSNAWFAMLLTGEMPALPESYEKLFGMKSVPVNDPGFYPPLDEIKAHYRATFAAFVDAIESLNDGDLGAPPAGESGGFVSNKLDVIIKAAWHEGWHAGQIAALRRGQGLPPLMGG